MRVVCVNDKDCVGYVTIGKVYDVSISNDGNVYFINDYGDNDIFIGSELWEYFSDYVVYRNNLIDEILS